MHEYMYVHMCAEWLKNVSHDIWVTRSILHGKILLGEENTVAIFKYVSSYFTQCRETNVWKLSAG